MSQHRAARSFSGLSWCLTQKKKKKKEKKLWHTTTVGNAAVFYISVCLFIQSVHTALLRWQSLCTGAIPREGHWKRRKKINKKRPHYQNKSVVRKKCSWTVEVNCTFCARWMNKLFLNCQKCYEAAYTTHGLPAQVKPYLQKSARSLYSATPWWWFMHLVWEAPPEVRISVNADVVILYRI